MWKIQTISVGTVFEELMIIAISLIEKCKSQNFLLTEHRMPNKKVNAQHQAEKVVQATDITINK